jgi:hypothetical protein
LTPDGKKKLTAVNVENQQETQVVADEILVAAGEEPTLPFFIQKNQEYKSIKVALQPEPDLDQILKIEQLFEGQVVLQKMENSRCHSNYAHKWDRKSVELINIVSVEDKPLSELIKLFQRYPTSGEINLKVADQERVLTALENKYREWRIDHLDGLSVDYPDWWFNARSSHIELLRVDIGATNKALLSDKGKVLC